jgi:hypothetical protein
MRMQPSRRRLLKSVPLALSQAAPAARFFRVEQRRSQWWLISPGGEPFFSIGMNHIDSATLRYAENIEIWRKRYGNSERRWLEEGVGANLRNWGFNCVGWTQEVVVRVPSIHRHSRAWGFEQYQWLGMPYCHLLPFGETHQWDVETRLPDFFSKDFEEWCDYVARDACQRMADDPKLIGYFYVDCPVWVHTGLAKWRGPIFDLKRLESQTGRDELRALATRYYQVTHAAIRRYDRNHLILGDRYEVRAPLADIVLEAAAPYVDVMSFQYFAGPTEIARDFHRFHELTHKPVLLADAPVPNRGKIPPGDWGHAYTAMIRGLREIPSCIGWHVCGAYMRNRARGFGFLDENDRADPGVIRAVADANAETKAWVERAAQGSASGNSRNPRTARR